MVSNASAPSGAEMTLLHAKNKMATGAHLTMSEKLAASAATAAQVRDRYGPGPADAEPIEVPMPETVKGAIANARS